VGGLLRHAFEHETGGAEGEGLLQWVGFCEGHMLGRISAGILERAATPGDFSAKKTNRGVMPDMPIELTQD